MFCDSHNFKIIEGEDGYSYAFHHRDLGVKEGHIYPNKKWSDVTVNNVPLDKTCSLEYYDEFLHILNEGALYKGSKALEINKKKVSACIITSESLSTILPTKKSFRERTKVRQKKGTGLKRKSKYRTAKP